MTMRSTRENAHFKPLLAAYFTGQVNPVARGREELYPQ
jgi:hypothetical protein